MTRFEIRHDRKLIGGFELSDSWTYDDMQKEYCSCIEHHAQRRWGTHLHHVDPYALVQWLSKWILIVEEK